FFCRICLRDIRTAVAGWTAALAFSLNRNLIFHALEYRPYGSLTTVALLIYWIAGEWVPQPSWSVRQYAAWTALVAFAVLFHAYGVLLCACLIGYWMLRSLETAPFQWDFWRRLTLPTFAALLLAARPWWYFGRHSTDADFGMNTFEYCGRSLFSISKFL